ncbi:response regulator [Nocardioides pantholopis]|uniref:response regulator n=1 Tax=Nocardioides pantholopis TaxID=2483798 RepID=UPI000F08B91C|nr:response regulator [Nocardioides pantholopis]
MTSDHAPETTSLRVLVADDFEPVRTLAVRMLAKLGHEDADEAEDGQQAVDALAAKKYDVLFLDLSMPRLTGQEVVRWLNAHPDRREGLTIVVISASAHEERPVLNELGVTHVLPKPFRLQQIADVLEGIRATS